MPPTRKPLHELLGDLAVLAEELGASPRPPRDGGSTLERFEQWFAFGSRLFHLAIETGIACQTTPLSTSERGSLIAELESTTLLADLRYGTEDGFRSISHEFEPEYGYFYGGEPWRTFCISRSGLEFLRDLVGEHAQLVADLDTAEIEHLMAHWGDVLFTKQDVPPEMPAHHWWWFGDRPQR